MDLEPETAGSYVRHAFAQMLDVAERMGDVKVNERPHGPDTNAVAAVVFHCVGVSEFWLGHVGLGRESHRDRDGEFSQTATVAELRVVVDGAIRQIAADLVSLAGGSSADFAAGREFLVDGDESDASLVLHVIEELFQHLGQIELTADALRRN